MKVTTEKPGPGVAELTVEVAPEDFDRAVDQAWRRIAGRVNIPGFRRGKAPRPLVERHVGTAAIDEEALRRLLPKQYDAAVEQTGVYPIERPSFDILQVERGKPLVFKATVTVRPTVELGDYRHLTIEPEEVKIDEEEVDRHVERLRESQAQWIPVEDRGQEMGDQAIVDLSIEFVEEDDRPGRTSERKDVEVVLGENGYPQGFDQELLGAKPGETREFMLSWQLGPGPGEPGGEEGKAPETRNAKFTVTVNEIKRRQLPELDDEFAKSLGNYDTLAEVKDDMRRRRRADALRAGRVATENKVIDAAIEQTTFEIADRMIDAETESVLEEHRQTLAQQRITLERYLAMLGRSEEDWRNEAREQAIRQLKARLVLDEVAEREGLTVSPEEIEQEIERTVQNYGDEAEQVRRALSTEDSRRRIENSLRRHKAMERLVQNAGGHPAAETETEAGTLETAAETAETPPAPPQTPQAVAASAGSAPEEAGAPVRAQG
ncbi:MAG: trigger factor [Chloroflexi bacterium]|nr:trigger factor [Chloroflexota bacterium]